MFVNNHDFGILFTVMFAAVFDKQLKQLRELFQLRERKQIWLRPYYMSVIDEFM